MGRLSLLLLLACVSIAHTANTQSQYLAQLLQTMNPATLASMLQSAGVDQNSNQSPMIIEEIDVVVTERAPTSVPAMPYCSAQVLTQEALSYINRKLTLKSKPTPSQRSLIAMIMTINSVSGVVGSGLDFDTAYEAVPAFLTLGENFPDVATDITNKMFNQINNKMEPLTKLYNEELENLDNEISAKDLAACDKKLDSVVRSDPSLKEVGSLVIQMGKLCKMLNSRTNELEKIAKTQSHKTVFSMGKSFLKPVIMQQAEVVKTLKSLS